MDSLTCIPESDQLPKWFWQHQGCPWCHGGAEWGYTLWGLTDPQQSKEKMAETGTVSFSQVHQSHQLLFLLPRGEGGIDEIRSCSPCTCNMKSGERNPQTPQHLLFNKTQQSLSFWPQHVPAFPITRASDGLLWVIQRKTVAMALLHTPVSWADVVSLPSELDITFRLPYNSVL